MVEEYQLPLQNSSDPLHQFHRMTLSDGHPFAQAARALSPGRTPITLLNQMHCASVAGKGMLDPTGMWDTDELVASIERLVEAYFEAGRGAEVVPLLDKIRFDSERTLGEGHIWSRRSRSWLAHVYMALTEWDSAIPLLETLADEDHVYEQYKLGEALTAAGRPGKAIPYLEQALRAVVRDHGPDHVNAVHIREVIDSARVALGDRRG